MRDASGSANRSTSPTPIEPIAHRVRERLAMAALAFDRRHGASRPKAKRSKGASTLATGRDSDPGNLRERACLRQVFRELGDAHRRYRAQTGHAGTENLRAAARAFKQEPSVLLLVPVAAFLDELGILAW